MPYIQVNDIEIYYEVHGDGEPLVLLSGLTMNLIPWTLYQVTAFTEAGYQVVLIDNRDVGRTSESQVQDYSIEQFTEDTIGVLDVMGIRSAHILGYSMGGMIALDMAIRHSPRVNTLTILGSTGKLGASEKNLLKAIKAAKEKMNNEEFWRFMANKAMTWRFFENEEGVARWFGFVTSDVYHQSVPALIRQVNACNGFDVSASLKSINQPTHIIVGEEDEMFAPRHSEFLAENISGAKLTRLPNLAHAVYSEGVDVFNPLVLGFLSEHAI